MHRWRSISPSVCPSNTAMSGCQGSNERKRLTKQRTCQARSPSEKIVPCGGRVFLRAVSKIHGLAEKPHRGGKHGKERNGSSGRTRALNYCSCKAERTAHQSLVCRTWSCCVQLLQVAAKNKRCPADCVKYRSLFSRAGNAPE